MVRSTAIPSPRIGSYCAFTGRPIRPWYHRAVAAIYHFAAVVMLPAICLYALRGDLGTTLSLTIGGVLSLIYLACLSSPRLHFATLIGLFAASVWAAIRSFSDEQPLLLAGEESPAWLARAEEHLFAADRFFLEAAGVSTFTFAALIFAALTLIPILITIFDLWRSRALPQRLWFASFHPVWRRPYRSDESPHPIIGMLHVKNDPLLTEKCLWLKLDRDADALRFGRDGSEDRVPLLGLEREVVLFQERDRWHQTGDLGRSAPAHLRLFLRNVHQAGAGELPPLHTSPASQLPVRDIYAADNGFLAKTYADEQDVELLGVLIDSRPNREGPDPALPRFTYLLRRVGQLQIEYAHKDLLGRPYLDDEQGVVHLPWRGVDDELFDLVIDPQHDSLHRIEHEVEDYYLLFCAFSDAAPEQVWPR